MGVVEPLEVLFGLVEMLEVLVSGQRTAAVPVQDLIDVLRVVELDALRVLVEQSLLHHRLLAVLRLP